jgi:hypothetical protein
MQGFIEVIDKKLSEGCVSRSSCLSLLDSMFYKHEGGLRASCFGLLLSSPL